ncbi:MAG: hypothetical protein COC13_01210 [Methanobacteriota archaeon]|nr:MAG: hypothetical protein COC13_01210 [Euryarchaeota archaeon]
MPANLVCHGCNRVFEAKRIDAKWCGPCRIVAEREKSRKFERGHKEVCPDCGGSMTRGATTCHPCESIRRREYYKGRLNPNWKEGFHKTKDGYIYRRVKSGNPGKGRGAMYRGEHVLVWERANNKPLPKGWVVHHLNGVKDDNRIQNLAAMSRHEHHSHPREALRPYERRIRATEDELSAIQQLRQAI